ncbi:unnamed protein product [Orchesella dallaii]|uniref:Uncharacterized protein n=1 Tax=Orchesella dallaii TaxID=48710 RepID=A0ABP1PT41_9HEXA
MRKTHRALKTPPCPGWEVKEDDDDDDESGDEDSEKDKIVMLQVQLQLNHRLLSFKKKTQKLFLLNMQRRLYNRLSPKLKMMNAKIKWDNKLIMNRIASTIRESVTEQAGILVNGKLKEYKIRGPLRSSIKNSCPSPFLRKKPSFGDKTGNGRGLKSKKQLQTSAPEDNGENDGENDGRLSPQDSGDRVIDSIATSSDEDMEPEPGSEVDISDTDLPKVKEENGIVDRPMEKHLFGGRTDWT